MVNEDCILYDVCPVGNKYCAINCETLEKYKQDQSLINIVDTLMRINSIENPSPYIGNSRVSP